MQPLSTTTSLDSSLGAPDAGESLFCTVQRRDDRSGFRFEINPDCSLMSEHFPGFPVVPASLIVGLIAKLLPSYLGVRDGLLLLDNVRFNRPVSPPGSYECLLQSHSAEQGVLFTINGPDGQLHTRGRVRFGAEPGEMSHAA